MTLTRLLTHPHRLAILIHRSGRREEGKGCAAGEDAENLVAEARREEAMDAVVSEGEEVPNVDDVELDMCLYWTV